MSHRIVSRYQRPVAFLVIWLQILTTLMFSFTPLLQARAAEKTAIEQSASTLQVLPLNGLIGSGSAPAPVHTWGATAPAASVAATPTAPAIPPSDMTLPELSSPFDVDKSTSTDDKGSQALEQTASAAMRLQGILGSDDSTAYAVSEMKGAATGLANQALQDWLNQVGHARTQMTFGQGGQIGGDVDLLVPLVDLDTTLLFSQTGLRRHEDRSTLNVGLGIRQFTDSNWMLGANTFFDYDLTGKNRRLGVGTEAWTDNLKLSANLYHGLTDWHQSPLQEDYDERPANGYDVRAEAYLPAYPQIGGKVMYEAYRGDNVALASFEDRSKNPTALTLGLNYTPVPLVTLGVDHKNGSSGLSDTQVSLGVNYRFGVPWAAQTDPEAVGILRSLVGSRYDFVARNNTIVLDYRKQDLIRLTLPETATAAAGEQLTLTASVQAKYGLEHIVWTAPELVSAGGQLQVTGKDTLMVTLPAFTPEQLRTVNGFMLTAVAYDTRGNTSNQAVSLLTVTQSTNDIIEFITIQDDAVADGKTENKVRLTALNTQTQQPVVGMKVVFVVTNGATLTSAEGVTDARGQASTELTNITSGVSQVTATLSNGNRKSVDTTFIADPSTGGIAEGDLTVVHNNAQADGSATNEVQAIVRDANNNLLAQETVSFSATHGAVITTPTGVTDTDGVVATTLTNQAAGEVVVTATLSNGASREVTVMFAGGKPAESQSSIVVEGTTYTAGEDIKVTVTLKDATGNAVEGSAGLLTSTTVTVPKGNATPSVAWVESTPGTYTATYVAETAGTGLKATLKLTGWSALVSSGEYAITPDEDTIKITLLAETGAKPGGKESNQLTATVTDSYDNLRKDVEVTFTVVEGSATFKTTNRTLTQNATTNENGIAIAELVSKVEGDNLITASADTVISNAVNSMFEANSVDIDKSTFTVSDDEITAASPETSILTLKARDADGVPVEGLTMVDFTYLGVPVLITAAMESESEPGTYTSTLHGLYSGQVSLMARVDGVGAVKVAKVITLTKNLSTAVVSELSAESLTETVDNSIRVIAHVVDIHGQPVLGAEVTFTTPEGAQLNVAGVTDLGGNIRGTLTANNAGEFTVTAQVATNGGDRGRDVKVTFTPGEPVQDGSTIVVDSPNYTAGEDIKVMVTLKDKTGGNTDTLHEGLKFDVNVPNATLSIDWEPTETQGVYQATYKAETAGDNLTATLQLTGWNNPVSSGEYAITADATTAMIFYRDFIVDSGAKPGGVESNTLSAKVVDAFGNPLKDASVDFTVISGSATPATQTVLTGADGVASAALVSMKEGGNLVTAKTGHIITLEKNSQFVPNDVDRVKSTFKASPSEIMAASDDTSTLTFNARDFQNEPVIGLTDVQISHLGVDVTITPVVETPVGSGTYISTLSGSIEGYAITIPFVNGVGASGVEIITLTPNPDTSKGSVALP
ncbi:inverse autotransporter beta domain-containing protein [Serratia sp. T13T92]|uniref:inverse autotransporter beta domain-containing protein n=1 Tax=Serratia sp. T13T92 TaxID=3397496 RepID=UPI0039DF85E1